MDLAVPEDACACEFHYEGLFGHVICLFVLSWPLVSLQNKGDADNLADHREAPDSLGLWWDLVIVS